MSVVKTPDAASEQRINALRALAKGSRIHISGICGTGTAAVAQLLKSIGFKVTGSDKAFYPPMGDLVQATVDEVFREYSARNLNPRPNMVIIGNSLSRGNPEVEYVLENNIPYASMPEVFAAFLIGNRDECKNSIVVAGTHGKTSTAAAITFILEKARYAPGYFIGGNVPGLAGNVRTVNFDVSADKRVVVVEGDEYDSAFFAKWPKFLSYRPDILVITSIEFDHADIYESLDEIDAQFLAVASSVSKNGIIFVCDRDPRVVELVKKWEDEHLIEARIFFYGDREDSPYRLLDRQVFTVGTTKLQRLHYLLGYDDIAVSTHILGIHSAYNLLVASAIAAWCGVNRRVIADGLSAFSGVQRRQEIIAKAKGITVIEDFAHHPTAVRLTLEGLKETYPDKRIIAVFEPRSNTSRRHFFQKEYAEALKLADVAVVKEVADAGGYSGTSTEIKPLDVNALVAAINQDGTAAHSFSSVDQIMAFLFSEMKKGDLVILMSNGDFGGLPQKLPEAIKLRS